MAQRLSRRKLADFVATKLHAGASVKDSLKEVAAYLVATKRTRELELLVRDIESALADRGVVIADVTSARSLSGEIKAEITKMIGLGELQFREAVDKDVLGGVRVNLPGKRFDGTIRRKLTLLRSKAI